MLFTSAALAARSAEVSETSALFALDLFLFSLHFLSSAETHVHLELSAWLHNKHVAFHAPSCRSSSVPAGTSVLLVVVGTFLPTFLYVSPLFPSCLPAEFQSVFACRLCHMLGLKPLGSK